MGVTWLHLGSSFNVDLGLLLFIAGSRTAYSCLLKDLINAYSLIHDLMPCIGARQLTGLSWDGSLDSMLRRQVDVEAVESEDEFSAYTRGHAHGARHSRGHISRQLALGSCDSRGRIDTACIRWVVVASYLREYTLPFPLPRVFFQVPCNLGAGNTVPLLVLHGIHEQRIPGSLVHVQDMYVDEVSNSRLGSKKKEGKKKKKKTLGRSTRAQMP